MTVVGRLDDAPIADLEHELRQVRAQLAGMGWGMIVDPDLYRVRLLELRDLEARLVAEIDRRALAELREVTL